MLKIIAIIAAVLVFFAVSLRVRFNSEASAPVQVLVAGADLPACTILSERLVGIRTMPRREIQQDAIYILTNSDMKMVSGLVSAVSIPKCRETSIIGSV